MRREWPTVPTEGGTSPAFKVSLRISWDSIQRRSAHSATCPGQQTSSGTAVSGLCGGPARPVLGMDTSSPLTGPSHHLSCLQGSTDILRIPGGGGDSCHRAENSPGPFSGLALGAPVPSQYLFQPCFSDVGYVDE